MIELMIVIAIMGIVVPSVIMLYTNVVKGFTKDDAQNQMKKINQETMLRFYMTLNRNKRIYSPAATAVSMAGRLNMTNCPAVTITAANTGDNEFPDVTIGGVLDPNNPVSMAGNWGNALLLLVDEGRVVCGPVTASGSKAMTVQLDSYRYYFYYLDRNPNQANSLLGTSATPNVASRLVEWRSALLVDFSQLNNFNTNDATLGPNIIKALNTRAAPNQPITYAVDPTLATAPASCLYKVTGSTIALSNDTIPKDWAPAGSPPTNGYKYLTNMQGSFSGRTCRYGIAPNSSIKKYGNMTIPQYAAASGNFPGGFEVGVVGTSGSRQVLVHQGLAAEGNIGPPLGIDTLMVFTCNDIY